MYRYKTVKERLTHPDLGTYVSYGIRAYDDGVVAAFVSDVSTDKHFVKELARKFTESQLSPCHLADVVTDAIP